MNSSKDGLVINWDGNDCGQKTSWGEDKEHFGHGKFATSLRHLKGLVGRGTYKF